MKIKADVIVQDTQWKSRKIKKGYITKVLNYILKMEKFVQFKPLTSIELSILLTDNFNMQSLNEKFLSKNYPTNVLSFPHLQLNWKNLMTIKIKDKDFYLGDLAFGYEIIEQESLLYEKPFLHHFTHLLIHGILHLFGFDHQNSEDAQAMENLEIDILRNFGITSPYEN